MIRRLLALSIAAFCVSALAAPTVSTRYGKVIGEAHDGVHIFKGIPYAAPPVGERRWAPPAPPASWKEPLEAARFGDACPQPKRPDRARDFGPQSEDCLTLNIWAPASAHNAPVMLWIHGGAFRVGKGGTPFYDGARFARQGIVLVSINYRLGYFGFFAHPALTAQDGDDALGNYGIMDQIAALEWVRDNIAAFGGSADRVTIFGESAGGSSVLHLLTIEKARGLFQQAIVQSGGGIQRPRYLSRDLPGTPSLEHIGTDVAAQLGLADSKTPIAALRNIPADEFVRKANAFAVGSIGFGPVIDGKLITRPLFAAFRNGDVAKVPLMIGANSNEASVLNAFGVDAGAMFDRLGPYADAAREVYRPEAGDDVDYMADLVFGDVSFVAPARAIAGIQSRIADTWLYHLDFVRERARGKVKGANHGADVILVFNSLDAVPMSRLVFTGRDREVARQMNRYWANFGLTGNPNGDGLPEWPRYDPELDDLLLIDNDGIGVRQHYRKAQLDFAMQVLSQDGS